MRLAVVVLLSICPVTIRAQEACQFGSSDPYEGLEEALSNAKSCSDAATKLHECAWGSSADTQFAPIVIGKCEKAFFKKLSPAGQKRYVDEMQLCAYEYSRQQGTLYMSTAALCQVDVSLRFAKNPSEAESPAPRASFDCPSARTPLETAICSDIKLGHADIVLTRVYGDLLKSASAADKAVLVRSEKEWLRHVPEKCGLAGTMFSEKSLNCVRNEFEIRFTTLQWCDNAIPDCLTPDADDENAFASQRQRASFDCDAPSTALQVVICADADLGQADIKLAQTYKEASTILGTAQHKTLAHSEERWLAFVSDACPLGPVGGIPSVFARGCLRLAFETRIKQLKICAQKTAAEQTACLNDFRF